jgi:hypothetical protein
VPAVAVMLGTPCAGCDSLFGTVCCTFPSSAHHVASCGQVLSTHTLRCCRVLLKAPRSCFQSHSMAAALLLFVLA